MSEFQEDKELGMKYVVRWGFILAHGPCHRQFFFHGPDSETGRKTNKQKNKPRKWPSPKGPITGLSILGRSREGVMAPGPAVRGGQTTVGRETFYAFMIGTGAPTN